MRNVTYVKGMNNMNIVDGIRNILGRTFRVNSQYIVYVIAWTYPSILYMYCASFLRPIGNSLPAEQRCYHPYPRNISLPSIVQ